MSLDAWVRRRDRGRWIMLLRLSLALLLLPGIMGAAQAAEMRFAYSSNDLDSSLARYSVDPSSGRLRFIDYLPLAKSPPKVVVDPSGRYLLALSQAINRVFVFRIDHRNGALTPAPGSPFEVKGFGPFSIVFHPSRPFLYIALRFSGVGAYAFDPETGAVTPLPGSPYPTRQLRTRAVEITPSGRFLYALNAFSNSISGFEVDLQTGTLHALPGSPYAVGEVGEINYKSFLSPEIPPTAGGVPYHMLLGPRGRFLLAANLATANISVLRIDPRTGRLTEVDGSPFFAGFTPSSLALHPGGRFVYALRVRDHLIEALELDPETGRLTRTPGSPYETGGQGPVDLVFADQGQRAYVVNEESNDVALLDVDARTGALRVREVVKTRSAPWSFVLAGGDEPPPVRPQIIAALGAKGLGRTGVGGLSALQPQMEAGAVSALAVGPRRLVYAIDRATDLLTAMRLDDAGHLQPIANGQAVTGRSPSDVAIDRNGWYAYVTNAADDTLSVYFIDPDSGQPRPVKGSPFKTGKQPGFISLDPAARYAYVVNTGDDTVSVYRYRSNVTPLVFETARHGSPFATGEAPMAVEIDPTGRYAYVANAGSNDISAYRIHHQTGALSALPGSPFKAGQRPQSLVSHPDGQWLYVANHDSADISVFRIEAMLGALVRVGSPVRLPFKPRQLQWGAADNILYALADDGRKLLRFEVGGNTGVLTRLAEDTPATPVLDLAITVE